MTPACKALLVVASAVLLLPPAEASAKSETGSRSHRTRIKVHPIRRWHGYGFLPGYRPWVNNLDRAGRSVRIERPEPRFINLYNGDLSYGWGYPGFYRGRWNGGSFGPCWTYTPIGMMPTCGQ